MIAFGIDPGSHRTGWGVIRIEGSSITRIASGVIRAPKDGTLSERIAPIFVELSELLREHRPTHAFVESVFHHKSAKSALILGHARGVALLAVQLFGCPITEITPAEVKKGVTGNGRAEKSQVQEMVRILLSQEKRDLADAADALAVAIAGSSKTRSALSKLRPSRSTA